jgi:hypothetical protein
MIASRVLPPPFDTIVRGYAWDGLTYPPPANCYGVGSHPFGLTFEQLQRWQCRLAYWDCEAQWTLADGVTVVTRAYGDAPAPGDAFPDFVSRIKQAMAFENGFAPSSGDTGILLEADLGCLSNADGTLFYPHFITPGALTGSLRISTVQETADWTAFATAEIHDGIDVFEVPLWLEGPNTPPFDQLNYLRLKPTSYLTS